MAGFVEAPRFYPYLTGRTNLEMLAAFDGGDARARIGEVLDLVELTDRAADKVGRYSHGTPAAGDRRSAAPKPTATDARRVDGEEAAFSASEEAVAALSIALGRAGIGIRSLEREGATLEQLFFRLTEGEGAASPDGRPQLVQEVA